MNDSVISPKSLKLNFIFNMSRTVLNFLIPLVTFPYVSRILGPEGLGKVEFSNSIVSYFVLFTALGIPTYGMREIARVRDDEKLRSKTVWELTCILAFTVVFGYALYFTLVHFVPQINEQKILFYIVAPTIFLSDFSFEWFYQGIENQTYITIRYICIKVMQVILIFLLIKTPLHFYRYAAIAVGLNSVSTVFNIFHLRKFICKVSLKDIEIGKHLKSIFIIFASVVAVNIYLHLDSTMIGFICGDKYVGLYSAANKVVRIIISLVTAMSAVIIPRLENCLKKGNEENYEKYLNLSLHYILILSIPCCIGLCFLSSNLIVIFAGKKYSDSAVTMKILSLIIFIVPLAYFSGLQILYPHRKECQYTFSVSIASILNLFSNFLLIPRFMQNGAAVGTVIAEFSGLLIQLIFSRNYLKKTDLFSLNTIKYLLAGIVMLLWLFLISFIKLNAFLSCGISIFTSAIVYGAILILMKEKLMTEILNKYVFNKIWDRKKWQMQK